MTYLPRAVRHPLRLQVRYRVSGSEDAFSEAPTRNISRSGMFLETTDADPGESVQLAVTLGDRELRLLGEGVRKVEDGLGIQFYGLLDQTRRSLHTALAA